MPHVTWELQKICLSLSARRDGFSLHLKFGAAPRGLHVVTQLILVERVAGGSDGQRGDKERARGG